MTIEALVAALLFGLILYDDDLAVLHVIAEGEGTGEATTRGRSEDIIPAYQAVLSAALCVPKT
jgi:hypothetical protein